MRSFRGLRHRPIPTPAIAPRLFEAGTCDVMLARASVPAPCAATEVGRQPWVVDGYLAPSHCADLANGCPIAALSGDLHTMPDVARGRFNDDTERLVARVAKLLKMLGAQSADTLAWSAIAEMMGALLLARTVSDPDGRPESSAARGLRSRRTSAWID